MGRDSVESFSALAAAQEVEDDRGDTDSSVNRFSSTAALHSPVSTRVLPRTTCVSSARLRGRPRLDGNRGVRKDVGLERKKKRSNRYMPLCSNMWFGGRVKRS
jgi:hypothetical protein